MAGFNNRFQQRKGLDLNMRLTEEQMDTGRSYWLKQLSGELPRTVLPIQYPKQTAFEPANYTLELPDHLYAHLSALGKGKQLPIFVVLLTAFQAWLGKMNRGQTDFALTIPALPLPSEELLSGGHIVIRSQMPPEAVFKETLESVKRLVAEGYKHQYVKQREITTLLGLDEGEGLSTPLAFAMTGLHREEDIRELCEGRHEAVAVADSRSDGIKIIFYYNSRLFTSEAISIFAGSFVLALDQYLACPDMRIGDALLMLEEDGRRLIESFNRTEREYSRELTIPRLFERQASQTPHHIAISLEGREVTYAELNDRANRLAALLVKQGITPGSYVAVILDRSEGMIAGVLGILKAGAAYVPIEPGFPKARVETILRSLPVRCIVTKQSIMRPFQELIWKIESLQDIVYLDVTEEQPPVEVIHSEMVSVWDRVAEEAVDRVTAGGFISSYSGQPFSEAEVDEYRDRVIDLAMPFLTGDSSVLEIGCGSGLISFGIAPRVKRFVGIDPSRVMLENNRSRSAELQLMNTEWLEGYGLELEGIGTGSMDVVLIASTAQFFPGYFYFETVVREAMRCLKPGGALIVADVMDLRRKEEFRDSLLRYREKLGMTADVRMLSDQELYCDEVFFTDLSIRIPDISHADILYRSEGFRNELGFRFDVVIRKNTAAVIVEDSAHHLSTVNEEQILCCRKRSWTQAHIHRQTNLNPDTELTSEHEAYVIFTSGTTGTPKGVVVRHRPVINLIEWVNGTFDVGPDDQLLFVTSLCFDLSVYDIFGILSSGGSIRIASEEELSDRERLLDILLKEPITFWDSAPAALQQLVSLMEIHGDHAEPNLKLRLAFLSGDWIPLALPDTLRNHFPNVQVIALGGATEATVWSNYYPVGSIREHWTSIPYGTPIQNARYYILDSRLQPCPPFVPGDLYIGGDCLASGYTDERQSQERFIRDPYREGATLDNIMYRTGDLARWMPNGEIEFLGRGDHQVKIRGYRIELGDIHAQLLKHPLVLEALVTDWAGSLCAYYVSSAELSSVELKEHLIHLLPDYMIPTYFIQLPAMPITSNGKINRSQLPNPQENMKASQLFEAPSNFLEEKLTGIWKEVLGLEQLGVTDDFYALGGDSLKAVQVVAKANELQFSLHLRDMLHYRTIRELVASDGFRVKEEAAAGIEIGHDAKPEQAGHGMEGDERGNKQLFATQLEELPYYYPCMTGAMYNKLRFETGYPVPRSFLPVGGGLGLTVFSVPLSQQMDERLVIDDIRDLPMFDFMGRLGIEVQSRSFASVEQGEAWIRERLDRGQLVIGLGTTYYLNFSHDYMMDEAEYADKLMEVERSISSRNESGIHHAHVFLLVDHTDRGYVVYDSTYHFFGTISEEELKRSFAGVGSMAFLKRYPLKHVDARRLVLDVTFERFQPIPLRRLAIELLNMHIQYYLSPEPIEDVAENRLIYTGLSAYQPFFRLIEDSCLNEEYLNELYMFVIFWIRKWKYTYIFFRDFLVDAIPLLPLSSIKNMIENLEESITYLNSLFDRLQEAADQRETYSLLKLKEDLRLVIEGLDRMKEQQRPVLERLKDEFMELKEEKE
ncbi:Anguibactin system regulator [compost metagenome]